MQRDHGAMLLPSSGMIRSTTARWKYATLRQISMLKKRVASRETTKL